MGWLVGGLGGVYLKSLLMKYCAEQVLPQQALEVHATHHCQGAYQFTTAKWYSMIVMLESTGKPNGGINCWPHTGHELTPNPDPNPDPDLYCVHVYMPPVVTAVRSCLAVPGSACLLP